MSSGLSLAWRCDMSAPKCSHDIARVERIDAEVRELRDLGLDAVGLRHEHLAERARVDEAQLAALREA